MHRQCLEQCQEPTLANISSTNSFHPPPPFTASLSPPQGAKGPEATTPLGPTVGVEGEGSDSTAGRGESGLACLLLIL